MVTAAGRTEETSDIAITYKEAKAMLEIKVTIEAKELEIGRASCRERV